MKSRILSISACFLTVFSVLCSCSKTEADEGPFLPKNETVVSIRFEDPEQSESRAFFGTTAAAESWEKSISSLTVYAFTSGGEILAQRHFTDAEISQKQASFALPHSSAGTNVEFYAVANMEPLNVSTKSALLALMENTPASYNGNFSEVSTKATRSGGFVMSGNKSATIGAKNTVTEVGIILKRTVAKIAIQTTVDAGFYDKYRGALRIKSATISRSASQTPVFATEKLNTGIMNYSHSQATNTEGKNFQNLFYLFENGTLSAGERVTVTLTAIYDMDGNFETTSDQTERDYTFELDGKNGGQLERNGYYWVSVNITSLAGQEIDTIITVENWENPISQSVNLGA